VESIQFTIKHNIGVNHIFDLLSDEYSLNDKFHSSTERHYFDTFDWRVYQNSYACGLNIYDEESTFFLKFKNKYENIYEYLADRRPRFATDITHPACQALLNSVLDIRALMHMATLHINRRELHVLNREHKTLIKIYAESYTAEAGSGIKIVPGRLIILPIKGYQKIYSNVLNFIDDQLKLPPITNSLLDEVLDKLDKKPRCSTAISKNRLSESFTTWEAVRVLLSDLLAVLQENETGLREAIDTEFLHDFRVAVRRTRSALTQIKHLFSDEELKYFKNEFYWLGAITSPTRDLDVYLLKFDGYMQHLPQNLRDDLVPFRQFLHRHWKSEHKRLCKALDSERYQNLLKDWLQVLNRETMDSPQALNAERPAYEVANHRIWKLYKEVIAEGRAIDKKSPDEDLHELRKTCKKLRYLVELFRDYYPSKKIKELINIMKKLQENLGDFQDVCIQTKQLNEFAQQMVDEGLVDTKTIMAMGVLIQTLFTQKDIIRSQFEERFIEFSSPEKMMSFNTTFNLKKAIEVDPK